MRSYSHIPKPPFNSRRSERPDLDRLDIAVRVTEGGNRRITESGDRRVLEE